MGWRGALQARNDEIELLTIKMMKDEKLMADKEDTLKTLSRVKEHTEATVAELEIKLVRVPCVLCVSWRVCVYVCVCVYV